jgi:hypothetical protein
MTRHDHPTYRNRSLTEVEPTVTVPVEDDTPIIAPADFNGSREGHSNISYHSLNQVGVPQTESTRDTGVALHAENLFDEDEDRWGNTANEATGDPFDNSSFTDEDAVQRMGGYTVELGEDGEELLLEDWQGEGNKDGDLRDAAIDGWIAQEEARLAAKAEEASQAALEDEQVA